MKNVYSFDEKLTLNNIELSMEHCYKICTENNKDNIKQIRYNGINLAKSVGDILLSDNKKKAQENNDRIQWSECTLSADPTTIHLDFIELNNTDTNNTIDHKFCEVYLMTDGVTDLLDLSNLTKIINENED